MTGGRQIRGNSGYTMIELLIVLGIIGIIASIGIPQMVRALEKGPMRQALADIVDGCALARSRAILTGRPTSFVIRAEDGAMSIRPASTQQAASRHGRRRRSGGMGGIYSSLGAVAQGGGSDQSGGRKRPSFAATLHEDVAVEELIINTERGMDLDEAVVTFYPNGVSDEMTLQISLLLQERRLITLDPIVGIPEIEEL